MAERFATANGSLALVSQRQDQTEQRLGDYGARLAALERGETERQKRDVTGLALSVWQFATR